MTCVAIDDEPLALNVIKDFCGKAGFLDLKTTFTSAPDAIEYLNQNPVDLIFLDIQMPHVSGLQFSSRLLFKPMIIFTTAYSEFAIDGFNLNAIDYLVKPVAFTRFFKAVSKAKDLAALKIEKHIFEDSGLQKEQAKYLMVKVEYNSVKIDLGDIRYIEGLKDYIKIYAGSRPILTKSTMKSIQEKLPYDKFVRIHKSYIVSVAYIKSIESSKVVIDDVHIPIGKQYKEKFQELIKKNML